LSTHLGAQTLISGTVNTYAPVTAIGINAGGSDCNSASWTIGSTRGAATPFATGDLVLVIQMQGATPNLANNDNFGLVENTLTTNSPLNNAGNYEFNRIFSIAGNTVVFEKPIANIYDLPGRVQLVRVPEYLTGATVTAQLTAAPWDGSSGGVIALVVDGTLTLNAATGINASGTGFRGGADDPTGSGCQNGVANRRLNLTSNITANKGEGITVINNNILRGRWPVANGGGGGQAIYGGGGGGANAAAGGQGGGSRYTGCTGSIDNRRGLPGLSLAGFINDTRIYMGGGGGAGHRSNTGNAVPGGNGGGIIIIRAGTLVGNNNIIQANGATPANGGVGTNGAGGGGAGGSILMDIGTYVGNITLQANGAAGANTAATGDNNLCPGPGGGGSGGIIRTTAATPGGVTRQVNGGAAGTRGTAGGNCANNLPAAGAAGLNQNNLVLNTNTACTPTILDIGGLCSGTFGQNLFPNGDFGTTPGTPGSVPGPGEQITTSVQWTTPTPVTVKTTSTAAPGYSYNNNPAGGPPDGQYVIATGVRNPYGNIGGGPAWITINGDNSSNGFMMVVNAAFPPADFYSSPVAGLCDGTKFEFRCDVINLYGPQIASESNPTGGTETFFPSCDPVLEPGCRQYLFGATRDCAFGGDCIRYSISPELEFLINGAAVATSGAIPNDGAWHTYGVTFETAPAVSSVNLQIRNRAPGGIGNDLALDNISFRPCGPPVTMAATAGCPPATINPTYGPDYATPFFQWQRSEEGTGPYTDIPGANSAHYDLTNPAWGEDAFRVVVAGSATNLTNPNCRITSDALPFFCPLPVEWLKFHAQTDGNHIRLDWQTAQEENNHYFAIERADPRQDFSQIGRVQGAGTTFIPQAYRFVDNQPLVGDNLYRLRQVDYDGRISYSNTVLVRYDGSQDGTLQVFPNPSYDGLFHLNVAAPDGRITLQVFNAQGQLVNYYHGTQGRTSTVDLTGFPNGFYTLRVIMPDGCIKTRLVQLNAR
jgi:hypothetical protein